ncbi:hypothetical protein K4F52_004799 [Lecanicillium sp. MT-2017a]|nr:hypothetical protein K4F52_004799 [Lecanicillium sp. MT-2017a]
MEARLLERLRTKLGELEGKLEAYRQNLVGDFHQFYESQLRDVDPAVVCDIEQAITPALSQFPNLRPSMRHCPADSGPPVSPKTATAFQTWAAPTNSGSSPDAPGSPRDRDHELQGLFTPSYLPLLAASQPVSPPTSTPADADGAVAAPYPTPPTTSAGYQAGLSPSLNHHHNKMEEQSDPGGPSARSLPPLQTSGDGEAGDRASDDSNSSETSDKGDSKTIRSALRRSSSLSKTPQSPRRVRFEFMGAEVLPTSSPQQAEHMLPRPISPALDGEQVTTDSILGDDSDDAPPPRKISSSDALRALSRAPLEDGTVWTVVNAQNDDGSATPSAQSSDVEEGSNTQPSAQKSPTAPITRAAAQPRHGETEVHQESYHSDDDNSSEEDVLAISKTIKRKGKAKQSERDVPTQQYNQAGDDMFHFEDEGAGDAPPPPTPERHQEEEDEDDDEEEDDASASGGDENGLDKSASAISSSVTMSKPLPKPEKEEPTSPFSSKFQIGSVGSYKGRSILMPIVKNPELHAQAASQGDFDSFVGGVDGRSGIDESDLSSYRASIAPGGFVGTPRSFTERLMMEDMAAERAKNGRKESRY